MAEASRGLASCPSWFQVQPPEALLTPLAEEGWTVHYPVVVSHSSLATSSVETAWQACGVAPPGVASVVNKVIKHALDYKIKVRAARRALYSQQQQDPG